MPHVMKISTSILALLLIFPLATLAAVPKARPFCRPIAWRSLPSHHPPVQHPTDRQAILSRLRDKVAQPQPLVAHILVPLCDNAHQGIVKVNASLGNGQNLKTNLYWGAGYGIRTHFQRQAEWKTLSVSDPAEPHILERLVMRRSYPNGATVVLVADAYDGAYMKQCLEDYLDALCGIKHGHVQAGAESFPAWGDADLLAFNGHNGLMDTDVRERSFQGGHARDAVVIACMSHAYFEDHLRRASAYPLVTTTNLLAPEAYIMRAIIDAWAQLKSGEEVDLAAAQGNSSVQTKCSLSASNRLFRTGW